jgi:DNA-binding response OmpR family regulator
MRENSSQVERFRCLLTDRERDIVDHLNAASGTVVPKADLSALLPGRAPRTLDTYIRQIRVKLRIAGLGETLLRTHIGIGYQLTIRLY